MESKYNVKVFPGAGFTTAQEVETVYNGIETYVENLYKDPKANWRKIDALQGRTVYANDFDLPGVAKSHSGANIFVGTSAIESTLNISTEALLKKDRATHSLNQISKAFGLQRLYLQRTKRIRKGRSAEAEENYDEYDVINNQLENVREAMTQLTPAELQMLEYTKIDFTTSDARISGYIEAEDRIFLQLFGQSPEQIVSTLREALKEIELGE